MSFQFVTVWVEKVKGVFVTSIHFPFNHSVVMGMLNEFGEITQHY